MANVFVTRQIPEVGLKLLRAKHTVRVWDKNNVIPSRELDKGAAWANGLLCLLTDTIDADFLRRHTQLKVVSNYAVGYNNIDVAVAQELGITVCNTPGVLTDAVAEHAIALMMAIGRRICESDRFVRRGKYKSWAPMLLLGSQFSGKTLGIIGAGRIGSEVATRCSKGLKMKVVYHNPSHNEMLEKETGARRVGLKILLAKSDVVSVHVPLLESTRHLINSTALGLMKKTAYLINTSRGPVIDEKMLVRVLKRKGIAGAGLDVFENEPKLSSGLAGLANVVLTPHTASATVEARDAMSRIAAENVLAVLAGKKAKAEVKV